MATVVEKKKKTLIIIAICIIWALIIAYNIRSFMGGGAARVRPDAQRRTTARSARPAADALPALRLDLLAKPMPRYKGVVRDIFSPFKVAPPPLVVVAPPPVAPMPSPLEVFVSQVRFMGFLEKGVAKTVFIGTQNDIVMVKKGDLVADRFRVVDITDTTMTFGEDGSETAITIELQNR